MARNREFDLFENDRKGPMWFSTSCDLEEAKYQAQRRADDSRHECFVLCLMDDSMEVARAFPSGPPSLAPPAPSTRLSRDHLMLTGLQSRERSHPYPPTLCARLPRHTRTRSRLTLHGACPPAPRRASRRLTTKAAPTARRPGPRRRTGWWLPLPACAFAGRARGPTRCSASSRCHRTACRWVCQWVCQRMRRT